MHLWDSNCTQAFEDLKEKLTSAPILRAPDWKKPFRCHVEAMQESVGGNLTQFDDEGRERVVAYYSRRLSKAEKNYISNYRELLGLVHFLKRYRCYLEGSEFENFTDNQVLSNFHTKKNLSRRETRLLDLFADFNIEKISLVKGKVHVLGDAHSRISQPSCEISNGTISNIQYPNDFKK